MALPCMRCASSKVADGVQVRLSLGSTTTHVDKTHAVLLAVDLDPQVSGFFAGAGKEYESCKLSASVCGDCGHVALVAEDGLRIYTAATAIRLANQGR